jgi:hypothetical protein
MGAPGSGRHGPLTAEQRARLSVASKAAAIRRRADPVADAAFRERVAAASRAAWASPAGAARRARRSAMMTGNRIAKPALDIDDKQPTAEEIARALRAASAQAAAAKKRASSGRWPIVPAVVQRTAKTREADRIAMAKYAAYPWHKLDIDTAAARSPHAGSSPVGAAVPSAVRL